MASPQTVNVDWGDVTTTTFESRSGKVVNNLSNNNALWYYISKGRRLNYFDGGREIYQELRYAENQSFMWYSGTEFLNVSHNDTMTAARFPIKQASIAVVLSGLEMIQNSGDEAKLSLIAERTESAQLSFENQMSAGVYSDGTGYGGKQIGGLGLLVSKIPSAGVVGGLDRSTQVWWRNISVNANTDVRGVVTPTNVLSYMNSTAIAVKRNGDGANVIVADNNYYQAYLSQLQNVQRITSESGSRGLGFTSLKYFAVGKEMDVILDGGRNGQIPNNTMYFLNTDYLHLRPSRERNFKVVGGDRANVNQDAIVRTMFWAGNLTMSNGQTQGVLWQ